MAKPATQQSTGGEGKPYLEGPVLVKFSHSYKSSGIAVVCRLLTVVAIHMWITLLIIAGIYLVGVLVLASGIWRAPEGFEDEGGFHEGRRDDLADDRTL
jgi:hypothetical protein